MLNTKNEYKEYSFYILVEKHNNKSKALKIGMTTNFKNRLRKIRFEEKKEYIIIDTVTMYCNKSKALFIESCLRQTMDKVKGFEHYGNDYFDTNCNKVKDIVNKIETLDTIINKANSIINLL